MGQYKVVCIDDEEAILEVYSQLVPGLGYEYHGFSNPNNALAFIKSNQKQIVMVISDFKMPEMTGFDLREEMIQENIEIPFALVTGFYNKEMAVKGMKLKVVRFLEKPFTPEEVAELLEKEVKNRITFLEEDKEMVTEFLQETRPMLEEIEELILGLEEDPHDMKGMNTYFRLLHTIKGTSSCLGLTEISTYAHSYEDLITKLKENELVVTPVITDVLLQGLDGLKEFYKTAENGDAFPEDLKEKCNIFYQDFNKIETKKDTKIEGEVESKLSDKRKKQEEKISVSVDLLGDFLEMSGELTVLRNTIFKSLIKLQHKLHGDKDVEHLEESLGEMQKISSVMQNQISELKKVTLDSVYRPMRRVVRDASNSCQKEVNFTTVGGDMRVDTNVGKLLNNILVHMLRNGVDHGIETPEKRIEKGKTAEGKLTLSTYETGENIILEIEDDGGGINKDKIKEKAIERELYTAEELDGFSDQKIYSILFESGLSTSAEVTSISGRGVGMDMVKSSIEEAGGKILIHSELGQGSKFVVVIPIPRSILIIKSLAVESLNQRFHIPLDEVAEVLLFECKKDIHKIHQVENSHILRHHGHLIPLVWLDEALVTKSERKLENQFIDEQNIVILKGENYKFGLIVDAIEDIEEVVVKKLSKSFAGLLPYLGVTFIGDGELSMIISPQGVAEEFGIENVEEEEETFFSEEGIIQTQENEFMRFRLEGASNYAIPLHWVFRLEELSLNKIQYTGSRALVRYGEVSLPLVFIEDELGLETQYERQGRGENNEVYVVVVKKAERLYGLVVNDIEDIGLSSEDMATELSDRNGIMGTVFIDESIVNVISVPDLLSKLEVKKERDDLPLNVESKVA
jgi:two-component system, chemotaxis family, sensor kinase CheA